MTRKKPNPVKITSAKEAAEYVAELHAHRDAMRRTDDRVADVAAGLEAWLLKQDEQEIAVEGLPLLRLRESTGYEYDVRALAEADVDLLLEYARAGVLAVSTKALREAVSAGAVTRGLTAYRSPTRGRRGLYFERNQ